MRAASASIKGGGAVVRTAAGSFAHARTKVDYFAYVPFMRNGKHEPCVMYIKQLLLVRRDGMGWVHNEARIATGILYCNLAIMGGAGLETKFNDEPSRGACVIPRVMHANSARMARG